MGQKRLKIAFLSRFVGFANRGVESHVLELSKRLSKNHQVDVLSGKRSDNLKLVLQGKYDLVIPTNGRWQALKMGWGRLFGRYKLLIAGHAGIGRDEIWNAAIVCPDIFVALTEAEKTWIKRWVWKSKLVKIPNGVDIDKFTPQGEKALFNLPRPVILSVGALTWYKHHKKIIRAVERLKEGSLLIAGSGPMKDEILLAGKELADHGRLKIIDVPYEKMPEIYRAADIFTLPSWDREAFGIVYLEAMASNLPVVAPDDLSRREIVGDAGILAEVDDPDLYAAALKKALSRGWGKSPRLQAEKFSWEKVAEKYEKLLEEVFP